MNPTGQLNYFRSRTDGRLHPYAVCATDDSPEAKPLVLEVSPGAISDLPGSVRTAEEIAGVAARNGLSCIALRPTGVGPGSLYQNYGEVDLFEAVEHVASLYPVDRDRITVTGASMGGAATWYLASHYPDTFAAAAPMAGYCDYRLWEKPGGLTYHMNDWEEPSWQSRSAAFLAENLQHTPIWIAHGEWDRSIGAGVSVEHSRQMAGLLDDLGYSYKYTEPPGLGHAGLQEAGLWDDVILWLLDQKKTRDPAHVRLATFGLRHNRSYWVEVDQLAHYGSRATVDAEVKGGSLTVRSEGVRTLSLGPITGSPALRTVIDGQNLGAVDLTPRRTFGHSDGSWGLAERPSSQEKRHGSSGPIGDMFFDRTILVPGTAGSKEERHFNLWMAENAAIGFRVRNGGVHRGGILGENSIELAVVNDGDLTEAELLGNNLILYGTHASNSILARFAGDLPLAFEGDAIRLSDRSYTSDHTAVFAVFPHPKNPDRYVAVHGGVTPDAHSWGSHLGMQLLPDYLVYSRDEVLDWGFFDNDWGAQS